MVSERENLEEAFRKCAIGSLHQCVSLLREMNTEALIRKWAWALYGLTANAHYRTLASAIEKLWAWESRVKYSIHQ